MTDDFFPVANQDAADRINAWVAKSNMLQWLDFAASLKEDRLRYRLGFAERHIGNEFIRALHGGVVSSFLQVCAKAEILGRMKEPSALKTVSVHCDFLRPARDMDMQAEARIIQRGRRIAFVEVTGWHNDPTKPVGKAAIAVRLF
ncbi:MAG: PaaI family thioesterase [Pseudomonadota bacterium]